MDFFKNTFISGVGIRKKVCVWSLFLEFPSFRYIFSWHFVFDIPFFIWYQ